LKVSDRGQTWDNIPKNGKKWGLKWDGTIKNGKKWGLKWDGVTRWGIFERFNK
jgi:hypothetical protein